MSFIETFDPENHTLLGEGVWGRVYDLKDGTVLKIAKEIGGIGSGREKVLHEIMVLNGLKDADKCDDLMWPEVIDRGDIPPEWDKGKEGFSIWMRSTKMSGTILDVSQIKNMTAQDQALVADSLGASLAKFHRALRSADLDRSLKEDHILLDKDMERILSQDDVKRLEFVRTLDADITGELKPVHGDFNISNILFGAGLKVSGILDFAETCLGRNEDDIASLTSELPDLKEAIIQSYEKASGQAIDHAAMLMANMKRDLISMIICRYRINEPDDARKAQSRLDNFIARVTGPSI